MNLTDNAIGDGGAAALSKALSVNKVLHTLGLGNNNIGSNGVVAISNMLETNDVLQRVTLENHQLYCRDNANKIGHEGMKALARMLGTYNFFN